MANQLSTTNSNHTPTASVAAQSSQALITAIRSPNDLAYTLERTKALLKLYYDPTMTDHDRAEMLTTYGKVMTPFPKWAVVKAFNHWEATGKHRPAPAALAEIARSEVAKLGDELRRRQTFAPASEPRPDKTFDEKLGAERILSKFKFTQERFDAVKKNRMAGNEAELYASKETINTHWTDNEPNDSPRMAALRKARSENPMMQQAIKASTTPRNQGEAQEDTK